MYFVGFYRFKSKGSLVGSHNSNEKYLPKIILFAVGTIKSLT